MKEIEYNQLKKIKRGKWDIYNSRISLKSPTLEVYPAHEDLYFNETRIEELKDHVYYSNLISHDSSSYYAFDFTIGDGQYTANNYYIYLSPLILCEGIEYRTSSIYNYENFIEIMNVYSDKVAKMIKFYEDFSVL